MSKKKDRKPLAVTEQAPVDGDPLTVRVAAEHIVQVLQQKYSTIFDSCLAHAKYLLQEEQARKVVAERDKEIEELKAKLDGKCAVKGAEKIIADGKAE